MKSLGRKGLMQKVGVGIIVGLDYWTGLLDSPKQNVQCRTEVHSVTSLMLLPILSLLEFLVVKVTCVLIELHL